MRKTGALTGEGKAKSRWCRTNANSSQYPSNGNQLRRKNAAPLCESRAAGLEIRSAVTLKKNRNEMMRTLNVVAETKSFVICN